MWQHTSCLERSVLDSTLAAVKASPSVRWYSTLAAVKASPSVRWYSTLAAVKASPSVRWYSTLAAVKASPSVRWYSTLAAVKASPSVRYTLHEVLTLQEIPAMLLLLLLGSQLYLWGSPFWVRFLCM